eukprot:CAMPEP_0173172994 /NCGR_PEP_ID=MMETSP1141-20130122/2600_1 /TAXON_ID=483371 /ORGANISM="non described non described, Strain CCMP2298" /LENGTH=30 /DNA_ID= /DNA_START= /DNA_END= /DNA_ORIENTATION=
MRGQPAAKRTAPGVVLGVDRRNWMATSTGA